MAELGALPQVNLPQSVFQPINPSSYFDRNLPESSYGAISQIIANLPRQMEAAYKAGRQTVYDAQSHSLDQRSGEAQIALQNARVTQALNKPLSNVPTKSATAKPTLNQQVLGGAFGDTASTDDGYTTATGTTFATQSDLDDYAKNQSLATGDNGVGIFGNSTVAGTGPQVALPESELEKRFGANWKKTAFGQPVTVRYGDKEIEATIGDVGGKGVDLNPDAADALGIQDHDNFKDDVSYKFGKKSAQNAPLSNTTFRPGPLSAGGTPGMATPTASKVKLGLGGLTETGEPVEAPRVYTEEDARNGIVLNYDPQTKSSYIIDKGARVPVTKQGDVNADSVSGAVGRGPLSGIGRTAYVSPGDEHLPTIQVPPGSNQKLQLTKGEPNGKVASGEGMAFDSMEEAEKKFGRGMVREAVPLPDGKILVKKIGGAIGSSTQDDTASIADAIISGEQPPTLAGLYRQGAAVRTELAKKGFDLTHAQQDWKATERHLATLNGPQQTRVRQAAAFAHDSLDLVDELGTKWANGNYPIFNKARMIAAKSGALGPDAQSLANQLDAQINDLTSEIATVYQGGNSATDHALQLAAQNLKSDFSEKSLKDNIELIRKNLRIRLNSLNAAGTAGIAADSAYTPSGSEPAPAPTPATKARVKVSSQAEYDALPPGTPYEDSSGGKGIKKAR